LVESREIVLGSCHQSGRRNAKRIERRWDRSESDERVNVRWRVSRGSSSLNVPYFLRSLAALNHIPGLSPFSRSLIFGSPRLLFCLRELNPGPPTYSLCSIRDFVAKATARDNNRISVFRFRASWGGSRTYEQCSHGDDEGSSSRLRLLLLLLLRACHPDPFVNHDGRLTDRPSVRQSLEDFREAEDEASESD